MANSDVLHPYELKSLVKPGQPRLSGLRDYGIDGNESEIKSDIELNLSLDEADQKRSSEYEEEGSSTINVDSVINLTRPGNGLSSYK